jgi:outer membrane protein assembly factor BamB
MALCGGTSGVGSDDGNVYAFDGNNGVLKWSYYTGQLVRDGAAIGSDGTVYVGAVGAYYNGEGVHVFALDGQNGTVQWSYRTSTGVSSSPAIGNDGTVYVSSDRVYALHSHASGLASSSWPMFQHDSA